MVTTGAPPRQNTHPTAPLDVAYWVQFRRGDAHGGPAYTGTYGFDWVEWKRNSANNPHTAYDDLVSVTGTTISNYVQCYDLGQPDIPAQLATATQPATPLKPGIPPHYAAVTGMYRQQYEDELHKSYDKIIVQGNDYYVPWLSLRPHQTVPLKLEVEFLNKNPVQATNLFTVAAHPDYVVTINGKTNAIPMQLVPKNKQVLDVTVECLRPSAATSLRVEDEHNNVVGQLNIADNTTVYELPLRVVYVLKARPMNKHDALGLTPPRPLYAPAGSLVALQKQFLALRSQGADLDSFLNQHSLNQALITCTFEKPAVPYQVLLDPDQWKKEGLYSPAADELLDKDRLAGYCTPLAEANYGPSFAAFRGITIFVFEPPLALTTEGPIAASGANRPVAARTLSVFQAGLVAGKSSTIAHEIGHVLGLTHAFPMPVGDEDGKVQDMVGLKEAKLMLLPGQRATLAKVLAAAAIPPTPADQAAIKAVQFDVRLSEAQLAEASAQVDMYANNPFKFVKQSTYNLMDYDAGDHRCSLWHWQWPILQADVATYYGTKSLAR